MVENDQNGRKMLENRVSDPEIDEIDTFGTCRKVYRMCTEYCKNDTFWRSKNGPKRGPKMDEKWTKNGPVFERLKNRGPL